MTSGNASQSSGTSSASNAFPAQNQHQQSVKLKNTFIDTNVDDDEALEYRLQSMPAPRIDRLLS
jgi:hypothetical protein